jgi:hypothetical protein
LVEYLGAQPRLRLLSHLKTVCHLPPLYVKEGSARSKRRQGVDSTTVYLTCMNNIRDLLELPAAGVGAGVGVGVGASDGDGDGCGTECKSEEEALGGFDRALEVLVALRLKMAEMGVDTASDMGYFGRGEVIEGLVEAFDLVGGMMRRRPCSLFDSKKGRDALFGRVVGRCMNGDEVAVVHALWSCTNEMTHAERPLYLYEALLVVGKGVGKGAVERGQCEVDKGCGAWPGDRVLDMVRLKEFPAVEAEHLDLHTRAGRGGGGGGGGRLAFATRGAAVADELPHSDAMAVAYTLTKALLDYGWLVEDAPSRSKLKWALTVREDGKDAADWDKLLVRPRK